MTKRLNEAKRARLHAISGPHYGSGTRPQVMIACGLVGCLYVSVVGIAAVAVAVGMWELLR